MISDSDSGGTLRTAPGRNLASGLRTDAWRLHLVEPGRRPRVVELSGRTTLGRSDRRSDIVLADHRVSGAHASLVPAPVSGQWVFSDLGSTNGALVDGVRQDRRLVGHNTVLRLGDTLAVLDCAKARSDVAASAGVSGHSAVIDQQLDAASTATVPLLLLGETGVGKSHYARRWARSVDADSPFVEVNVATLPGSILESELFGVERGAFTGASTARPGLIEAAQGGVLFLDEVTTLEPAGQAALLTVLDTGEYRRVGSTKTRTAAVRLVTATNADPDAEVAAGRLRADLLQRLKGRVVSIAPLRERRTDIIALVRDRIDAGRIDDVSAEAWEALLLHAWPGNVRELLHAIEALPVDVRHLDYVHLPGDVASIIVQRAVPEQDASRRPTRAELEELLRICDGNVSEVARQLGEHRNQVVRWLDGYGLR